MTIFYHINCLFNRLNFDFVGQIMNKKFLKKAFCFANNIGPQDISQYKIKVSRCFGIHFTKTMDYRHGIHRVGLLLISFITGMTIILNFHKKG